MVTFGSKATRESIERSESSENAFQIRGVPQGSTTLRFLDDLGKEEWTEYWEHFDQDAKKFFPCSGKDTGCPGCEADLRVQKRYLVNALVISSDDKYAKSGYVNLYKIPASLMEKFLRRTDRAGGTITDRDYELIRSGKGLDTEYDLETGDKSPVDVTRYADKMINHESALEAMWNAYVAAGTSRPAQTKEVEPELPDDLKAARDKAIAAKQARERRLEEEVTKEPDPEPVVSDDPPSDPQPQSASADAEETITEESLRAMSVEQLVALYELAGIEAPRGLEANELVDDLIRRFGD